MLLKATVLSILTLLTFQVLGGSTTLHISSTRQIEVTATPHQSSDSAHTVSRQLSASTNSSQDSLPSHSWNISPRIRPFCTSAQFAIAAIARIYEDLAAPLPDVGLHPLTAEGQYSPGLQDIDVAIAVYEAIQIIDSEDWLFHPRMYWNPKNKTGQEWPSSAAIPPPTLFSWLHNVYKQVEKVGHQEWYFAAPGILQSSNASALVWDEVSGYDDYDDNISAQMRNVRSKERTARSSTNLVARSRASPSMAVAKAAIEKWLDFWEATKCDHCREETVALPVSQSPPELPYSELWAGWTSTPDEPKYSPSLDSTLRGNYSVPMDWDCPPWDTVQLPLNLLPCAEVWQGSQVCLKHECVVHPSNGGWIVPSGRQVSRLEFPTIDIVNRLNHPTQEALYKISLLYISNVVPNHRRISAANTEILKLMYRNALSLGTAERHLPELFVERYVDDTFVSTINGDLLQYYLKVYLDQVAYAIFNDKESQQLKLWFRQGPVLGSESSIQSWKQTLKVRMLGNKASRHDVQQALKSIVSAYAWDSYQITGLGLDSRTDPSFEHISLKDIIEDDQFFKQGSGVAQYLPGDPVLSDGNPVNLDNVLHLDPLDSDQIGHPTYPGMSLAGLSSSGFGALEGAASSGFPLFGQLLFNSVEEIPQISQWRGPELGWETKTFDFCPEGGTAKLENRWTLKTPCLPPRVQWHFVKDYYEIGDDWSMDEAIDLGYIDMSGMVLDFEISNAWTMGVVGGVSLLGFIGGIVGGVVKHTKDGHGVTGSASTASASATATRATTLVSTVVSSASSTRKASTSAPSSSSRSQQSRPEQSHTQPEIPSSVSNTRLTAAVSSLQEVTSTVISTPHSVFQVSATLSNVIESSINSSYKTSFSTKSLSTKRSSELPLQTSKSFPSITVTTSMISTSGRTSTRSFQVVTSSARYTSSEPNFPMSVSSSPAGSTKSHESNSTSLTGISTFKGRPVSTPSISVATTASVEHSSYLSGTTSASFVSTRLSSEKMLTALSPSPVSQHLSTFATLNTTACPTGHPSIPSTARHQNATNKTMSTSVPKYQNSTSTRPSFSATTSQLVLISPRILAAHAYTVVPLMTSNGTIVPTMTESGPLSKFSSLPSYINRTYKAMSTNSTTISASNSASPTAMTSPSSAPCATNTTIIASSLFASTPIWTQNPNSANWLSSPHPFQSWHSPTTVTATAMTESFSNTINSSCLYPSSISMTVLPTGVQDRWQGQGMSSQGIIALVLPGRAALSLVVVLMVLVLWMGI